ACAVNYPCLPQAPPSGWCAKISASRQVDARDEPSRLGSRTLAEKGGRDRPGESKRRIGQCFTAVEGGDLRTDRALRYGSGVGPAVSAPGKGICGIGRPGTSAPIGIISIPCR